MPKYGDLQEGEEEQGGAQEPEETHPGLGRRRAAPVRGLAAPIRVISGKISRKGNGRRNRTRRANTMPVSSAP